MRILLIAGGWSEERDVSLSGARGIHAALERLGHQVTLFDPCRTLAGLLEAAQAHDFAFLNLHGQPGEDGLVQALLETAGVPYQGSGPAGSFLALNKAAAKEVFVRNGLPTPEWVFLPAHPGADWEPPFAFPAFIKSNNGGSSLALHRVSCPGELARALDELFTRGGEAIIEPAVEGVEVTCGVLGDEALPPILIRPLGAGFFDYASKYTPGQAEELCPAPLPGEVTAKVREYALRAHRALGLRGYSRSDFILTPAGALSLLEVNTLPGMTATSLLPQEAAAVGISFDGLIGRLIELGLAAHGKQQEKA
ncbi:D-alanine/D-alanine ligase [Oleidesulfovibrio alaskensis G20]|jgi:D-alanine-D-alanine ligase|uniref:D-alanine--D-alanine ligase n=1 Tax=Oleidesulfovibrio alaskensis (strain ATCC BAA-1058 / DSM 17464 / G20) TaxID=207559 RepID=DDL_OLEA2|nr:D-alanine--D-alanine ligase [Oleidesulfovibrio alaskensis]Q316H9.1 RecName: Full=D-alanine--D-alanine ligase; AltName: Full=D-Ala-D-Ala ligase; AltName: Full=D-alanylalanine synthetase [Oleidesulfovibrio alaskensis G20]ABB37167.1 D-alanine/D-alanine ligase [Oleidesulfovibrio alaskensis G20]MBG0774583.1 D-alanine--D-alanine ligase [Oleidesulfovibrio alaskensis]MBL3582969.1 D-alanine--D-alanine ligase [Oleidesulfovibrio alaskensis]